MEGAIFLGLLIGVYAALLHVWTNHAIRRQRIKKIVEPIEKRVEEDIEERLGEAADDIAASYRRKLGGKGNVEVTTYIEAGERSYYVSRRR